MESEIGVHKHSNKPVFQAELPKLSSEHFYMMFFTILTAHSAEFEK